jgi:hypothetical protein
MFLLMSVPVSAATTEMQSGWQGTTPIGWYGYSVTDKTVAINAAGEMLAVMVVERASDDYSMVASYYTPGRGWSQLSDAGIAGNPMENLNSVADGKGNFWMVNSYRESTTKSSLYATKYNTTAGWTSQTSLQNQDGYGMNYVTMVADSGGNVTVAWIKVHLAAPYSYEVMAKHFDVATGWGAVMSLHAVSTTWIDQPMLASADTGNAAIAWTEYASPSVTLYTSRYVPHFGWSDVEALTTQTTSIGIIGMGFGANGAGVIAWSQGNSGRQIFSRTFTGSTWQSAVQVSDEIYVSNGKMAVNHAGQAMMTWTNNSDSIYLRYATYSPASGWSAAAAGFQIEPLNSFDYFGLYLAENGHAMIVYSKLRGFSEHMGYFSRGFATTWGSETMIAGRDYNAYRPEVVFGSQGMAVLLLDIGVMNRFFTMATVYIPSHMPAPSFSILSPTSGQTSSVGSIHVIGNCDPGARISVNGVEAYVDAAGAFDVVVPLSPGDNVLTVSVTGPFGNTVYSGIPVKYVDAAQQKMQTDINNLSGQGTMYLLVGIIALIVAVVAIVLLFMRRKA